MRYDHRMHSVADVAAVLDDDTLRAAFLIDLDEPLPQLVVVFIVDLAAVVASTALAAGACALVQVGHAQQNVGRDSPGTVAVATCWEVVVTVKCSDYSALATRGRVVLAIGGADRALRPPGPFGRHVAAVLDDATLRATFLIDPDERRGPSSTTSSSSPYSAWATRGPATAALSRAVADRPLMATSRQPET